MDMMQALHPDPRGTDGIAGPRPAVARAPAPQPAAWRPAGMPTAAVVPEVVTIRTSHGRMTNYNYMAVDPASRQSVLIDPAWEIGRYREVVANADAVLSAILVTHAHPDHVDLAGSLAAEYGCPIWMSSEEVAASGYAAPGLVAIDEAPRWVGRMRVEPLLTPGHTPGSVCYRIGENLFTGDVLFAEGCGLCPDAESAYRMYDSLERLKRSLTPATRIFPGHSFGRLPGRRFEQVLQENIYLHFRDRERFAAFRLRGGQDRSRHFDFR